MKRDAWGWLCFPAFFFVVIFGGYVLPTVLIGIVSISFDEASNKAEQVQEMVKEAVVQLHHEKRIKAKRASALCDWRLTVLE